MVLRFEQASLPATSIDEFYARIDASSCDRFSAAHIAELAHLLQQLAADETLLISAMEQDAPWRRRGFDRVDVQSHWLPPRETRFGFFQLRFCIWVPAEMISDRDEGRAMAFEFAHNHDFRFLTVGYAGGGYRTRVCSVTEADLHLPIGSRLGMTEPRMERLDKGAVLYFEPGIDIHTQIPPDDISVSLNLMLESHVDIPQMAFDLDAGTSLSGGDSGFAAARREEANRFLADLSLQ